MIPPSHIDLVFPVQGTTLPRDHGYALYGALCRAAQALHGATWLTVHNIPGRLVKPDTLDLERRSSLRLRIPIEEISKAIGLAGAVLDVGGHRLALGAPAVHQLKPAAVLDARLVVIKLTGGPGKPFDRKAFEARFLGESNRQLSRLGVSGEVELRGRASMTVGGRRIIGCPVRVSSLTPEHSLLLQVHGLGGKRAMGCGVFRPARWKQPVQVESAA